MNSRRNFLKFLGVAPAVPAAAALAAQFPEEPLPVVADPLIAKIDAVSGARTHFHTYLDATCMCMSGTEFTAGVATNVRLFTDHTDRDPHADEDEDAWLEHRL